jgi:hypothetical protein
VNPNGGTDREKSLGDREDEIRSLMLGRIRDIAKTGAFWSQAIPSVLLWSWWGATLDGKEARNFVRMTASSGKNDGALLEAFIQEMHSSSDGLREYVPLDQVRSFIEPTELKEIADRLNESAIEEDVRAAQRFLRAYGVEADVA